MPAWQTQQTLEYPKLASPQLVFPCGNPVDVFILNCVFTQPLSLLCDRLWLDKTEAGPSCSKRHSSMYRHAHMPELCRNKQLPGSAQERQESPGEVWGRESLERPPEHLWKGSQPYNQKEQKLQEVGGAGPWEKLRSKGLEAEDNKEVEILATSAFHPRSPSFLLRRQTMLAK